MADAMTEELPAARAALEQKMARFHEIAAEAKIESKSGDGSSDSPDFRIDIPSAVAAEMKTLKKDLDDLRTFIDAAEGVTEIKSWSERPLIHPSALRVGGSGELESDPVSLGEMFTSSREFKEFVASGESSMRAPFVLEGKNYRPFLTEHKDVYTASGPTVTTRGFGRVERDPFMPAPQRMTRVRDLFPARPTAANLIDFFRVTGFLTGGDTNAASMVPERSGGAFAAKPQTSLTYEGATAPVRTIAHWEAAHRNVLADEPQLQAIINNELLYGLRLREDDQILNGAGTSEDLPGILNDGDIQALATSDSGVATDEKQDTVRRAITLTYLSNFAATGVVLHPNDWEDMELSKDGQDRYLITVSVAVGATARLWTLPVVSTPAIAEGTGLVGAFGLGAQLYDREVANIRVADQHADFFIRNAVVILAEQRMALALKRPESFVKITFD